MLEDKYNPEPKTHWKLVDWLDAAGGGRRASYNDLITTAVDLEITPPEKPWNESTLSDWNKEGLKKRTDALAMITVLREIAARNRVDLFSVDTVIPHSRIFMLSKACSTEYAEPRNDELWSICRERVKGLDESTRDAEGIAELRSLVYPRPPLKLFGRKEDERRLRKTIRDRYVTVIDAVAGDGKTALAWHTAYNLWKAGEYVQFDWTSNKRYSVDAYGNPIRLDHPELNFEGILRSMVKRFGWSRLLGKDGESLLNGCADNLRKGHYLVVIDNLETMSDEECVVAQLLDMLVPASSSVTQTSRALITSRIQVDLEGCGRVSINGIEEPERESYIEHLEEHWLNRHTLSAEEKRILADLTAGSPLLLQIAMRYYTSMPEQKTFDQIVSSFDEGRHKAFPVLFDSLLQQLSEEAVELAKLAANDSITSHDGGIDSRDLLEFYEASGNYIEAIEVFNLLVRYRILSPIDEFRYSMHPLIRAYLHSLLRSDHDQSWNSEAFQG